MYTLSLECIAKSVAVFSASVVTSFLKKFCLVDILVVSFGLEELFVKFVCSMTCQFFSLLISLCTSLVVWFMWRSSVLAASLDHVQRWKFVSESCSLQNLIFEFDSSVF